MRLLYSTAITCYALGVRIASLFNEKVALMRKGWHQWSKQFPSERLEGAKTAWFHAASLGEFEQARPVIEAFRKKHPDYKICLSFFSPSGYEIRKNYKEADVVCYLPPDTRCNARKWMELVHPNIAFFVKYDFWFNYLQALKKKGTPTYIFSAIFRPTQYFFRWYGGWFARQLQHYTHLFVQNDESLQLLHSIGITHCDITGDTRFDRVNEIARQAKPIPIVEHFIANGDASSTQTPCHVLIAGSSWEPDETNIKQFLEAYSNPLKVILAPHMIGEDHLALIERLFSTWGTVRYSHLATDNPDRQLFHQKVLIIDNIGMLSSIYRYAHVSYIGGGFGKGIHNTLEAAIYNCPVCFGPNYGKFQEARELIEQGGAKSYNTASQLTEILTTWLDNNEVRDKAASACRNYMEQHLGATETIMERVESL